MHCTFRCQECQQEHPLDKPLWRCPCGGLLWPECHDPFEPAAIETGAASLWRYAAWLPDYPRVTLGEGWTPLLPAEWAGRRVWFKCDHHNPTGSYKDRGATVQVSRLAALGIDDLVEDSSGNAGSALAVYAARAGLTASIFVPAEAPAAKLRMIRDAGAELVAIPDGRDKVDEAVRAAAETRFYASHVWDPTYLLGTRTLAFEIVEQLGWLAPDAVVTPVGNGAILLGLWLGFDELVRAEIIERMPRLVGVQAQACAPLYRTWARGKEELEPIVPRPTVAGGVVVAKPARAPSILRAVRSTLGRMLAIDESEIVATQAALARQGWYVEPTGALGVAGLASLPAWDNTVVVLTGHGLKSA